MVNTRLGRQNIDWIALTVYICLLVIGWLMLYAVTYDAEVPRSYLKLSTEIGKQTLWMIISLVLFALAFAVDWKFWSTFSFLIYAICMVLLLLVLVFGAEVKGSKSWFQFGVISFQPSELAKFGTALAVSSYLSLSSSNIKILKHLGVTLGLILLPMFLILLQPDAGSAAVMFSFFIVLYRAGLSPAYYIIAFSLLTVVILSLIYSGALVSYLALCVLCIIFSLRLENNRVWIPLSLLLATFSLIFFDRVPSLYLFAGMTAYLAILVFHNYRERKPRLLTLGLTSLVLATMMSFASSFSFNLLKPHQQDRINVWLNPDKCDPRGSLYNLIQAKTAIGSGGFSGKGYLKGNMTQNNFIPEQATDFIFAAIGEEQGFVGIFGVVLLFLILLIRLTVIAERAKNNFIKYYAYSVAGILFFHFFINIGMTMGIMPVIGIPLPFLSRGGSSLAIFSLMIALAIKMDTARNR